MKEHELPVGPGEIKKGNFTPDEEIAELWKKAENNQLSPEEAARFERLMGHEYIESSLMENGLPYRSAHPDAWDLQYGARATPNHYGAHDVAPLVRTTSEPFAHWPKVLNRPPPSQELGPGLSNIDNVVSEILGGL